MFKTIDKIWFEEIYKRLNLNKDTIHSPNLPKDITIDLTEYSYIAFYNLINLSLLIAYLQNFSKVQILFYGLGPNSENKLLDIEEYNRIRRDKNSNEKNSDVFQTSDKIYNFIAYLQNYGFFNSLQYGILKSNIIFPGFKSEFTTDLYQYKDIGTWVLPIIPISTSNETFQFRNEAFINIWINEIAKEFHKHPIFSEGEFARVFGYQLTQNIIEHGINYGLPGLQGAINMQLIPASKYDLFKSNYETCFKNLFNKQNLGILEIVIGDKGPGIFNTLHESFSNLKSKLGFNNNSIKIEDVIPFAFDEIGTRKIQSERIGGVHALHRILKSTAKYGGIIKLTTNGKVFIYDLNENELQRVTDGFGFKSNYLNDVNYPIFGSQFHILIPLKKKDYNVKNVPKRDFSFSNNSTINEKIEIVPISILHSDPSQNLNYNEFIRQQGVINVTNKLRETSHKTIIVYDFGGYFYSEEDVIKILYSQKSILHTKKCIIINFPVGLVHGLREREKVLIDQIRQNVTNDINFIDVLSSKHRLLPVYDIDRNLFWFGLGKYNIDGNLDAIFNDNKKLTEQSLYTTLNEDDIEICKLFLDNNNHLFLKGRNEDGIYWQSTIKPNVIININYLSIYGSFKKLLNDLGCILEQEDQYYILPSSKKLTKKFFQSTPFLHNNPIANQVGRWLANAITEKLQQNEDQLLIVTSTAPAELLSTIIFEYLNNYSVNIINLGYYSYLNESEIIATKDWSNIPIFIVTDVIDKGTTSDNIVEQFNLINKKYKCDLKIRGLLALVQFQKEIINEFEIMAKWSNEIWGQQYIDTFIFSNMLAPKNENWNDYFVNNNANNLYLIEPFSLDAISIQDLAVTDNRNTNRLQELAMAKLLREGHFIYENHHFSVTTCIKELFKNTTITNNIKNDISKIIKEKRINLLIIPLHSHIRDFIPSLLLTFKLALGVDLEYYYCIASKVISDKPFYILPKELKNKIENNSKQYSILILDDAIATGRTQETILRALFRVANHNSKQVITNISVYTIIDRLGRAKNTLWSSIVKMKLTNGHSIDFNYKNWVLLDMPVYDQENCPICKEMKNLLWIKQQLNGYNKTTFLKDINNRILEITPHSTESSGFIESKPRILSQSITLDGQDADSIELGIWLLSNLISRGYPYILLIKEIDKFTINANLENKNDVSFILKSIKILIEKWNNIESTYDTKQFRVFLENQIKSANVLSKPILSYIGSILPEIKKEEIKNDIIRIVDTALKILKDIGNETLRENLKNGIILFLAFYKESMNFNNNDPELDQIKYNEIKESIKGYTKNENLEDDIKFIYLNILFFSSQTSKREIFLSSLNLIFEHTLRAQRSDEHPKAFPKQLYNISKGKVLTSSGRDLLLDTITNIVQSFENVQNYYPNVFNGKFAQIRIIKLNKQLNKLSDNIVNDTWIDNKPSNETIDLARNILAHFPHNRNNSIHDCLQNITIALSFYCDYVNKICKTYDITDFNIVDEETINKINVIIPPNDYEKEVILNFLKNYLPEPIIEDPKIEISFRFKKDYTILIIKTRLKPINKIESFGLSHGLFEIKRGNTKLFGVKPYIKRVNGKWNTAQIKLEFLTAHKKDIKNEK